MFFPIPFSASGLVDLAQVLAAIGIVWRVVADLNNIKWLLGGVKDALEVRKTALEIDKLQREKNEDDSRIAKPTPVQVSMFANLVSKGPLALFFLAGLSGAVGLGIQSRSALMRWSVERQIVAQATAAAEAVSPRLESAAARLDAAIAAGAPANAEVRSLAEELRSTSKKVDAQAEYVGRQAATLETLSGDTKARRALGNSVGQLAFEQLRLSYVISRLEDGSPKSLEQAQYWLRRRAGDEVHASLAELATAVRENPPRQQPASFTLQQVLNRLAQEKAPRR